MTHFLLQIFLICSSNWSSQRWRISTISKLFQYCRKSISRNTTHLQSYLGQQTYRCSTEKAKAI